MTPPRLPRSSDVRGAVRLAVAATAGVTDLVEAMHARIVQLPGFKAPAIAGRTSGITGLVYKTVRGVTRLAGGSLDALLGLLPPALDAQASSSEREAVLAALNGVLGDYLANSANPLATTMTLRSDGRTLDRLPDSPRGLLVLVHGLCMNDQQWLRDQHDHGRALQRDLGLQPVYLRYNSGRQVSDNGRDLARLLETKLAEHAQPIDRLLFLCHSMGGLVARSALHFGAQAGQRWPTLVSDLVFLGTPHHGAPLERAGQWVDILLGATPYAAPFTRLTQLRSAGITDLRHGNLIDDHGPGQQRFARSVNRPTHVALPTSLRCFAVAGRLARQGGSPQAQLLGDGLVPVESALGQHAQAERSLQIAPDRLWVAASVNHMTLLSDAGVYRKLLGWLK